MKKFLSIIISALLIISVFVLPTSAAGTVIAFSSNTITIGDKVTVTVTVNPGVAMYAVGYKLEYDSEKLSYDGAAGVIKVVESPSGETKFTKQFTFTSKAVGTASIKVKECGYAGADLVDKTFKDASATLTIKDVALSNNNNLSSLTLSKGTLSPNFTSGRTNYTATVPYDTDKINIYTTKADPKAKVAISTNNPANLNVGDNVINVTVTAQSGSQKIYTITVKRLQEGTTDTPTPPITPNENPYETVISGKKFEILTNIPQELRLENFIETSVEYNGKQVPVLRDNNNVFTVYYLREVGTTNIAPYLYNSELETFEILKHQYFNNSLYIFTDFPTDFEMPENYHIGLTQIGDYSVRAYLDSEADMIDFSYVYCFANGNFGLYRFDSKENTIQRYPDIQLVTRPSSNQDNEISTGFAALTTQSKIIVISIIVAILCVILLIIFLIIMAIQRLSLKNNKLDIEDDFDFDDVMIIDDQNNDISSNSK